MYCLVVTIYICLLYIIFMIESTEEHVKLLVKVLPSFVKKMIVRTKEYLKVNKNYSLKEIYNQLEQYPF